MHDMRKSTTACSQGPVMQLLVVIRVSVYADVGRSPGLCWSCGSSTRGGEGGGVALCSLRAPQPKSVGWCCPDPNRKP